MAAAQVENSSFRTVVGERRMIRTTIEKSLRERLLGIEHRRERGGEFATTRKESQHLIANRMAGIETNDSAAAAAIQSTYRGAGGMWYVVARSICSRSRALQPIGH
jgi:hypothetical protein